MKPQYIYSILSQKYQYDHKTPQSTSIDGKYLTYIGIQKQLTLNVSIKVLLGPPDISLTGYLNKLKTVKSEQVIKIYQIIAEASFLVVVTEQVVYGTLAIALLRCRKLEQNDALYLGKYLLVGYMDMLRAGVEWAGTVNDLQFTQMGLKISWNNTMPISTESSYNFKEVLQNICMEKIAPDSQTRLLPFPQSKQARQMLRLSQTSASQISLSPMMKKKQKWLKRRLPPSYLLLRQSKHPNEYFQQTVYLAVSSTDGFLRVKAYKSGHINPTILELNKTKNTFTKVIQVIQQKGLIYIISAYSNEGTLQGYVQRLRASGVQLRDQQIQFFFYSLFQPLKAIQHSSIRSLNMSLHIRNVYIQSGVPKIGEPVPLNDAVMDSLRQRKDVPDFYHPGYKAKPDTSDPSFDTYSLGVLLYKLMYTEYPIFPQGKVHIPTTPTFSPRLKKTLQIFLNKGGKLSELQKQIQVSQNAIKQVKKNKQMLLNAKRLQQKSTKKQKKRQQELIVNDDQDIQNENKRQDDQKQIITHQEQQQESVQDDCFECCVNLDIADHAIDPSVESLHQSPYRNYRLWTKLLCFLLIYILVMYMFFLRTSVSMLSSQGSLSKLNITISTLKYEIITSSESSFHQQFNLTSKLASDLLNMGCLTSLPSTPNPYWQLVSSSRWTVYILGGLALFLLIILMKCTMILRFDYIRAKYNYQHGVGNFNYINFAVANFMQAALVNAHFCYFNGVFYSTLPACLGSRGVYAAGQFMIEGNQKFLYVQLPVLCGIVLLTVAHFAMVCRADNVKYTKIFNPLLLFAPFLLAYSIVVRIGVFTQYFYPSALSDPQSIISGYFKQSDYVGILGIIPQILFLIQFIINKFVDLFYWMLIDKKRRVMIQQNSTQNIQIYQ